MITTLKNKALDKFPILHTPRLDLIEIKQQHLKDIFKLLGDKRVTQFYNVVTLMEKQEAQKYIDWFRIRFEEGLGVRWGIALKEQNSIIGTIGFNNFIKGHRSNIGYDLHYSKWNKGYLTEALVEIVKFGFSTLDVNRIEAEVMQGNAASERVLEKAGFKKEGILRQWMLWNGKHYDMTMYSLLKSDFMQ